MPEQPSKYEYDVFISYSHADERWVMRWLVPRLKKADLRVCVDQDDFEIGVPSVINMERAVEKSCRTLLVLTPSWVTSEWANFEALLLFAYDPIGQGRRMLPLILKKCELPKRLAIFTCADFTRRNRWEREFQRITETIGESVIAKPAIPSDDSFAPPQLTISTFSPFVLPQLTISTFTGRVAELKRLERLLLKRKGSKVCSIVGLAGSGGVGKTALACQFAELHREQFPDGVIGLRVDGKDVDALARQFVRCVGEEIAPQDERNATTIMQDVFGSRRALLIFDNADNETVNTLRPGGNKCAVIITTRDRRLPSLLDISNQDRIELPVLPDPDSLLLFERLLGKDRVAAEQRCAEEIIKLVGNLPLALQIVGANLQIQEFDSLCDYAASLRGEQMHLEALSVRSASHLDVRASFLLSLKLLDNHTIDFLACLSVCAADGFSMQSAMAAGNCDEFTSRQHLNYLYRLSLLNRPQFGANRFVLHPLIRILAKELAIERSLQDSAAERHARFFIELVKSSDVNDPAVASVMADELDDIMLAVDWLQGRESFDEALEVLQRSYVISEQGDDQRELVVVLNNLGDILQQQGDYDKAIEAFQHSLAIFEQLGDQHKQAQTLNSLGDVLQRQGRFDEAVDAFQRSLAISEQLGGQIGQATALNNLGSVLQRQGRLDRALHTFQQSLAISGSMQDQYLMASVLNSIGGVLQRQGKFDESFEAFGRSYYLLVNLNDQRGQAMVLNSLGGVLQRQGRFDEAVKVLEGCFAIETKLENHRGQAMVLNSLGGVLQRQGKFDESVEAFRRSYAISEELGDQRGQAMVLNSLGGVLQRQGKFDESIVSFQHSHDLLVTLKDQRGQAMVLNSLGGVLQRQGKFDESVEAFQRSYAISEGLGDQRSLAMVLNSLGGVLQRQGKFDEAMEALEHSYAISEQMGDQVSLAMVHFVIGKTLLAQGKVAEAIIRLCQSFEINLDLKHKQGVGIVTPKLIQTLIQSGKLDEASSYYQRAIALVPKDRRILQLREQLSPRRQPINKSSIVRGKIKRIIHSPKGYRFGFVVPDSGAADIYFHQKDIDPDCFAKLAPDVRVEAEVVQETKGLRAISLKLID